jgi:nitroimidazol reductase NimA-like FMN-containing flavoprotein (pyridoxamine 5'-phosphate oxidase superfamily)
MILPVNYVLDGVTIVFQTTSGTALSALDEVDVAFEVDNNRPLNHAGWSVVVQGRAVLIRDAGELDRLRRGPLRSWAWRAADIWIAISIDKLSGRHIPEREGG